MIRNDIDMEREREKEKDKGKGRMQGRGNHQGRGKPLHRKPRAKPLPIRIRLSEVYDDMLIDCYENDNASCSFDLYAQRLFVMALTSYHEALMNKGRFNNERKG